MKTESRGSEEVRPVKVRFERVRFEVDSKWREGPRGPWFVRSVRERFELDEMLIRVLSKERSSNVVL